jgi:hypothetical protein
MRDAKAQAELYATWPPFNWSMKLRNRLSGSFPRQPLPSPSNAAQFGIIPPISHSTEHTALTVDAGPKFGASSALERVMAQTARLDLGVDATPSPANNGWARIVEDILETAPLYRFRGEQRFDSSLGPISARFVAIAEAATDDVDHEKQGPRGPRFAIVQIGFGPEGLLD